MRVTPRVLLLLASLFLAIGARTAPASAPTWLVVSPDAKLLAAIAPLADHRRAQGFEVVTSTSPVEEAIATLGCAPDYLLLLGDDALLPAKRGSQYRWLSTQKESFAADALFSDLDGDGLPDFPVGRIPTDRAAQINAVVHKIIAYETRALTPADLNLPIWSGTPAYGKLLDETADWLLMSTVNKYAPGWAQPWLITANPSNTLNAWPADHVRLFNQQLQKGAAFTAMMGHGATDLFLSMENAGGSLLGREIVYTTKDARSLDDPLKVSPPLVIFACDCGNFAHLHKTSLAETLLLGRGGPVATIAATTESHPLTNYYSSIALMQELTAANASHRTGDLWLAAQLAARKMSKPLIERMLKNVEGALEVEIDIPKLKRDQMQMYAFLGDPALGITLPRELDLSITKTGASTWTWSVTKPAGAEKLIVQQRAVSRPLRVKPDGSTRQQALELFAERNAQFAFQPLGELAADTKWSGTLTSPGDLRLIAIGKGTLHTATSKLR